VTEPVTVRQVAREAFGAEFSNTTPPLPTRYDVRTRHAQAFGGTGDYLQTAPEVLRGIAKFVQQMKGTCSTQ